MKFVTDMETRNAGIKKKVDVFRKLVI